MARDDCPRVTDKISIPERTRSDEVLELSSEDWKIIDGKINKDGTNQKKRIRTVHFHGDKYKIESKQYVGIATLPSGNTIEVYPKIAKGNGPYLISYAYESGDVVPTDANTGIIKGSSILMPLATSFSSKVDELLRTDRLDHDTETRYSSSGGRLNTNAAMRMAAGDYSAMNRMFGRCAINPDTQENRILYEGGLRYIEILNQIEQDHSEAKEILQQLLAKLNRWNVKRPLQPKQTLRTVQRNPPNRLYDELFQLVSPVLDVEGIDLSRGRTPSHSYFVDMDVVFESVIDRAIKSSFRREYRITSHENKPNAFSGPRSIGIEPDLVMRDEGNPVAVIDAKWQDSLSNSDFHKSLSYGTFYSAPSLMVYPKIDENSLSGKYDLGSTPSVHILEIPVGTDVNCYQEFVGTVETETEDRLTSILAC